MRSRAGAVFFVVGLALAGPGLGQELSNLQGTLFPEPLRVEHAAVEREADGTVFYGEPVRDTYAGSWIVSERPDGSRLVIDLARREMTEIRPAEGVFWTIDFARFAELRERLARFEPGWRSPAGEGPSAQVAAAKTGDAPSAFRHLEVRESPAGIPAAAAFAIPAAEIGAQAAAAKALQEGPTVRRFEVRRRQDAAEGAGAQVWVDGRFQFGAPARRALDAFDREALGSRGASPLDAGEVVAAVREAAAGALPVRSVLPIFREGGEIIGHREDRVSNIEKLTTFSAELVRVPEGLRRLSHPFEGLLLAMEAEARNDAELAGRPWP